MSSKYSLQNRLDEKAISVLSNYFQNEHGDIFDIQFHGIKDNTPDTDGFVRLRKPDKNIKGNVVGEYLNKVVFFQLKGQAKILKDDSFSCPLSVVDFCKDINLPTILFVVAGLDEEKSETNPAIYWYYFDSINVRILDERIGKLSKKTDKIQLHNLNRLNSPNTFWEIINELAKKDSFQDLPKVVRENAIEYKDSYINVLTALFLLGHIDLELFKKFCVENGVKEHLFQTVIKDIIDSKQAIQSNNDIIYQPFVDEFKRKIGILLSLEGIYATDIDKLFLEFKSHKGNILKGLSQLTVPYVDEILEKKTKELLIAPYDDLDRVKGSLSLLDNFAFRVPNQTTVYVKEVLKSNENSNEIVLQILGLLNDHLRYKKQNEVIRISLNLSKSDETAVSSKAKEVLKNLAKYDYHFMKYNKKEDWYIVQERLLQRIEKIRTLGAYFDIRLLILEELLSTGFDGTEMQDEKTMTIHQGGLTVTDQLSKIRERGLNFLFSIYHKCKTNKQRLQLLNVISSSIQLPHQGYSDELESLVIKNIDENIIPFYLGIVEKADFIIISEIENQVSWYLRRFKTDLKKLGQIKRAILEKDKYDFFKLLIGNSLVDDEFERLGWSEAEKMRNEKIKKAVEKYKGKKDELFPIVEKFLNNIDSSETQISTRYFDIFLQELSEADHQMGFALINKYKSRFGYRMSFILNGLLRSAEDDAKKIILSFIGNNEDVLEVIYTLELSNYCEIEYLEIIAEKNKKEMIILNQIIQILFKQYDNSTYKDGYRALFVKILASLNSLKDSSWHNHLFQSDSTLIDSIEEETVKIMINNLVFAQDVSYYIQEILSRLVDKYPLHIINLFKMRIEADELKSVKKGYRHYSTIPFRYDYDEFGKKLVKHSGILIPEVLTWFGKNTLSDYQVGNFLDNTFDIDDVQKYIITENGEYIVDKNVLIRLISAYQGHMSVTNDFVRHYVKTFNNKDDWKEIMGFLSMTGGVVSGEYGFFEDLEKKLKVLQEFDESDPDIQSFIEEYKSYLIARMKYEKESTDRDIALRKQQFS